MKATFRCYIQIYLLQPMTIQCKLLMGKILTTLTTQTCTHTNTSVHTYTYRHMYTYGDTHTHTHTHTHTMPINCQKVTNKNLTLNKIVRALFLSILLYYYDIIVRYGNVKLIRTHFTFTMADCTSICFSNWRISLPWYDGIIWRDVLIWYGYVTYTSHISGLIRSKW